MSILRGFDRWWYGAVPPDRLATLRIVLGGYALVYIVVRGQHLASVAQFSSRRFEPVGVVGWLPGPLPAALVELLVVATVLAGLAFVAGWRFRVTGPAFAMLLLWVTSYRNSWGQVFHTENLMVLHVLVLALTPAASSLALDARGRRRPAADGAFGWPIRLMCALTALTYVIAGVTKLRISGLDWVTEGALRGQVAYDNLRKIELGDSASALGPALLGHPALFTALAALTLALELGAPLSLVRWRGIGVAIVAMLWGFHVGILALMAIVFPYQLLGFAFAPYFAVERPARHVIRRVNRLPHPGRHGHEHTKAA